MNRRNFLKWGGVAVAGSGTAVGLWNVANPKFTEEEKDAALKDLAQAAPYRDDQGVAYGARFLAGLDRSEDGAPILHVATRPYAPAVQFPADNFGYAVTDPDPLPQNLVDRAVEAIHNAMPEVDVVLLTDPIEIDKKADLILTAGNFVPSMGAQAPWSPQEIDNTVGNSFSAQINGKHRGVININSGNSHLAHDIAQGRDTTIRALFLNELFNALAVRDFQNLEAAQLNDPAATNQFLDRLNGRGRRIDEYTVTRSGGPREDDQPKELDRLILQNLQDEAEWLREQGVTSLPNDQARAGKLHPPSRGTLASDPTARFSGPSPDVLMAGRSRG